MRFPKVRIAPVHVPFVRVANTDVHLVHVMRGAVLSLQQSDRNQKMHQRLVEGIPSTRQSTLPRTRWQSIRIRQLAKGRKGHWWGNVSKISSSLARPDRSKFWSCRLRLNSGKGKSQETTSGRDLSQKLGSEREFIFGLHLRHVLLNRYQFS